MTEFQCKCSLPVPRCAHASGRRWRNTSPSRPPTAKLSRRRRRFAAAESRKKSKWHIARESPQAHFALDHAQTTSSVYIFNLDLLILKILKSRSQYQGQILRYKCTISSWSSKVSWVVFGDLRCFNVNVLAWSRRYTISEIAVMRVGLEPQTFAPRAKELNHYTTAAPYLPSVCKIHNLIFCYWYLEKDQQNGIYLQLKLYSLNGWCSFDWFIDSKIRSSACNLHVSYFVEFRDKFDEILKSTVFLYCSFQIHKAIMSQTIRYNIYKPHR